MSFEEVEKMFESKKSQMSEKEYDSFVSNFWTNWRLLGLYH